MAKGAGSAGRGSSRNSGELSYGIERTSDDLLSEIEVSFPEGDRQEMAWEAGTGGEGSTIAVVREGGQLVGVAKHYSDLDPRLGGRVMVIDRLATAKPGVGRPFLEYLHSVARRRGVALVAVSTSASEGFYKRMGMHLQGGTDSVWYFPREGAK